MVRMTAFLVHSATLLLLHKHSHQDVKSGKSGANDGILGTLSNSAAVAKALSSGCEIRQKWCEKQHKTAFVRKIVYIL